MVMRRLAGLARRHPGAVLIILFVWLLPSLALVACDGRELWLMLASP